MEVQIPDDRLERILGSMNKWTDAERSKYCDEASIDSHPLFTKQSGTAADIAANPQLAAVANVAYDDVDTPESLAKESKDKGNAAFARGPDFYGNALRHYNECILHAGRSPALLGPGSDGTQAAPVEESDLEDALDKKMANTKVGSVAEIAEESNAAAIRSITSKVKGGRNGSASPAQAAAAKEVRGLISTAHANIAAIHLARKKYISAVDSAQAALSANPFNVKAAYRAGKACLALGRAVTALDFAQLGLELEPENAPLLQLVTDATALRRVQKKNEEASRAQAEAREVALDAVRDAVKVRGLQVGPPQWADQRRTPADPFVDSDDGSLHWPVLLLYPEYGQSDYLEDVPEGASMSDILATVLPEDPDAAGRGDAPPFPGWDARREYCIQNVSVFYRSHVSAPVDTDSAWSWARAGSVGAAAGGSDDGAVDGVGGPPAPKPSGKAQRWVHVPMGASLAEALGQRDHVIPDVPVLYVIARTGKFYASLREKLPGGVFAEMQPTAAV